MDLFVLLAMLFSLLINKLLLALYLWHHYIFVVIVLHDLVLVDIAALLLDLLDLIL